MLSENIVSIVGLKMNAMLTFVSLPPLQMRLEIVVGGEAQGQFWLFSQESAWNRAWKG